MRNLTLLIAFFITVNINAQWTQVGDNINGEAEIDQSGYRVALNADGSIIAVGAYLNDGNGVDAGHVRIYENNSGVWEQIGNDIDGEAAGNHSSRGLSISSDGSIVAIGAMYNSGNGTNSGHVRVYENNAGNWEQIGDDINGEAANDFSGYSVSLSSDGTIVAIGSVDNSGNGTSSGQVRIFQNNAGNWTQVGNSINGETAGDHSGYSVGLSSDGTIVAIGAYKNADNGTNSGHVRVYENNSGTWNQIGDDIDGEAAGDYSGTSLSISNDGSIVAIGAYANDGNGEDAGQVRVYENNSGTWTQVGDDIDGEAADEHFGISVSLNAEGNKLAVGAPSSGSNTGLTRVYENTAGSWVKMGNDIIGEAVNDLAGTSVSLEGSTLAVGAPGSDGNGSASGQAKIYSFQNEDDTQWTTDTDVNTLVAETESEDMQAIGTSDGQTYVVFWKSVGSPTNYELRLQLLDAIGNRQFGSEGMLISDNIPMSTFTVSWSIAIDENDYLYVGVTGTGDYSGHIFKVDMGGNLLWGADGVSFSNAFQVTLLPMQNGEVIASWVPGDQALMQKYDASGNTVWSSPQPIESGSSKTAPGNMYELSNGDYMMIFHTYNYGVSSTLYAQKYDTDGSAQWTSPTQLSNTSTAYNAYYSGTQDGDVVYYGYKGDHSNRFDSYLQRINPDGSLPWGINGMDFDVNETDFEMETKIAFSPSSQYVWSICNYADPNQSENGVYVQKFDKETGARQFTDNAKMVYAISSDDKVHASDLYLIDDKPFFLLKTGYDNGATPTTLDVLLLDNNGDFAWEEETKPMATYAANKKRVHLTETINGQSVAVFIEDKSTGLKIYAQNFIDELTSPAQPSLISPVNGAINIPLTTTFVWDIAQGAETYHIQIAEDDAFSNLIADENDVINTNFDFILPDYETTYYWRVMASNSAGDSEWSEIWNFTTIGDVPAQPTLISPDNGATGIDLTSTFTWDNAQGAETYHIQIADNDAFNNLLVDESGIANTNYVATLADYEITYYWRVMASNSIGDSDWSAVWSFTTEDNVGIDEFISNSMKVYPNPAKDIIFIDFDSQRDSEIRLAIYNSMGNIVMISKDIITLGKNTIELDIQKLPAGTYYYQLTGEEINLSGRFLKIK